MMIMITIIMLLMAKVYWVLTMCYSEHSQKPRKWLQVYFPDEETKDK